ncbi:MAG: PAS domain S-box protein [Candidatus Omnitrophota bacterium]
MNNKILDITQLYSERDMAQKYLDVAGVMIVVLNNKGNVTLINRKGCEILGRRKEEIINKGWFANFIPASIKNQVKAAFNGLMAGKTKALEYYVNPVVAKKGKLRLISWHNEVLRDDKNVIIGTLSSGEDISDRRIAEESLLKSEEGFRSIFENAKDAIFWVDGSTHSLVNCNLAAEKLFERNRRHIIGKHQSVLFPPKTRDMQLKLFKKLVKNGGVSDVEAEIITKTRTIKPVQISSSVADIGGRTVMQVILRDITERKSAEGELRLSKYLVDKAAESIFLIDRNGRFKYVNENACNALGYTPDELLSMTVHDIDTEFPKKVWPGHWKELKRKKSFTIESTYRTKEGESFPVEISLNYLELQGNEFNCASARNIYERKKAQERLFTSEKRFRALFENSPVSLWEEDLSNVKKFITKLSDSGVDDFEKYFKEHPEDVADCATMVKILEVNKATLDLYKAKDKKEFWGGLTRIFTKESYHAFREELISLANGKTRFAFDCYTKTLGGKKLKVNLKASVMPGYEKDWSRILISVMDISELTETKNKLAISNRNLLKSNKKLEQLVLIDSHTGLFNYRYLTTVIETEFYRAKRYGYPLSILMVDLDYFKSINDVYGHQFGDLALKQFASQLKNLVRRNDIVIRSGGEEFLVISPRTDLNGEKILARKLLDALHLYNFGNREYSVKLKISIAVCSYPEDPISKAMDLVTFADKILSKSKEFGGNNVFTSVDAKERKAATTETSENVNTDFLKNKIEKLNTKSNQNLMEAIFAFARTIEVSDPETGDHVERTVRYATELAEIMRLSTEDVDRIKKASILHDLGKVGIRQSVLNKRSSLTAEEFEEIKRHPQIGVDIIRPIRYLHDVIPLILDHHERWDGKGYPNGLKGEDIPIGARIIAIADAYQALTSDRPYRKAFSKERAIEILKEESGTKYDPQIVDMFLKVIS